MKFLIFRSIASAAAVLAASSLHGAPVEQITCPIEDMTDADFQSLTNWLASGNVSVENRSVVALELNADACAQRHGWSEAELLHAAGFAVSLASNITNSTYLRSAGVDIEQIEFAILSDEAFMDSLRADPEISEKNTVPFVEAMVQRVFPTIAQVLGNRVSDQRLVDSVLLYVTTRGQQEVSRELFAAD